MRVLFFGSDTFSIPSLEYLVTAHALIGVVTAPDRPRGRGGRLGATPVKEWAVTRGIPVFQPEHLDGPATAALAALTPDAIVVISYGRILPAALLDAAAVAPLNIHPSLLPAYRGAAPIEWALIRGERETGVTAIRMSRSLDRGDIVTVEKVSIGYDDTIFTLRERLAAVSVGVLARALELCCAGVKGQPQSGVGSYAPKLSKEDGKIDWSQDAASVRNLVRGVLEWPGAWTVMPTAQGQRLIKIWECRALPFPGPGARPGTVTGTSGEGISIACGRGTLLVTKLQMEGRKVLTAGEFLRGHPIAVGTVLGSSGRV